MVERKITNLANEPTQSGVFAGREAATVLKRAETNFRSQAKISPKKFDWLLSDTVSPMTKVLVDFLIKNVNHPMFPNQIAQTIAKELHIDIKQAEKEIIDAIKQLVTTVYDPDGHAQDMKGNILLGKDGLIAWRTSASLNRATPR